MSKRGILFVVSGPSGTGKGTVLKRVFERVKNVGFSVSATTRNPRPNEVDGVHYHFVTQDAFDKMAADGEMLEYVCKFGNCYGTPKRSVEDALNKGRDIVLEIETLGGEAVKKALPEAVLIFIAPPSMTELAKRLETRENDAGIDIAKRKKLAFDELRSAKECYRYVVVNDTVEKCAEELERIITAERCKLKRIRFPKAKKIIADAEQFTVERNVEKIERLLKEE